jgi:hypothetical protein
MKSRKLFAAALLAMLAQFAWADALNDCLEDCTVVYKQCLEARNAIETCDLARKNCETDCRKKTTP